jgi:hypothetical protein
MKVQILVNIWADDGHELVVVIGVLIVVVQLPQFSPQGQGLTIVHLVGS